MRNGFLRSTALWLKATLVGGLLFLLPAIMLLLVLKHALEFGKTAVSPLVAVGPPTVLGASLITVCAVVLLLAIALAAGLFARTATGSGLMRWIENFVLGNVPQYQLVKSMAEGLSKIESEDAARPALVEIEGGWQLCYLLERLDQGMCAVFLPQAPTPMSGTIMYMPADRIRALDIGMVQAMSIIRKLGAGSAEALRGVDLRLPGG